MGLQAIAFFWFTQCAADIRSEAWGFEAPSKVPLPGICICGGSLLASTLFWRQDKLLSLFAADFVSDAQEERRWKTAGFPNCLLLGGLFLWQPAARRPAETETAFGMISEAVSEVAVGHPGTAVLASSCLHWAQKTDKKHYGGQIYNRSYSTTCE